MSGCVRCLRKLSTHSAGVPVATGNNHEDHPNTKHENTRRAVMCSFNLGRFETMLQGCRGCSGDLSGSLGCVLKLIQIA